MVNSYFQGHACRSKSAKLASKPINKREWERGREHHGFEVCFAWNIRVIYIGMKAALNVRQTFNSPGYKQDYMLYATAQYTGFCRSV